MGNKTLEDAWNFRGRGLLQITGRGTYKNIQGKINSFASDSEVKIEEGQDRHYTPKEAAVTGMADWFKDSMYLKADETGKSSDDQVVDNIINIINSRTPSRPQRKAWYRGGTAGSLVVSESDSTKSIFKVEECGKTEESLKFTEGRAPWMNLAWLEEAKRLVETGTNKEIQKFFDGTPYEKSMKNGTTNESIYWCGAFVNWIMTKYGYIGLDKNKDPYDSVRALKWAEWKNGRTLSKPVYGAIAVKRRTGGGHVGFVAGKKGNKVVILGGNQGNSLKCSLYDISAYFAYIIPTDYVITDADYELPEYNGNPSSNDSET